MSLRKAELHVHLEGSLSAETLAGIDPAVTPEEAARRYRYDDFPAFLRAFKWVVLKLNEPAHYALAARELFQTLAAQNVVHAEVNLSVGVMLWRKLDVAAIYDAVAAEAARAPLTVRWIFDAVRQFGPEAALDVAKLAAERRGAGVVGFGIGGDEASVPAREFADTCRFAQRAGLHIVPHAGETTDAANVWSALLLGAERIGHGIRAAEDEALCDYLREEDIPLEISITSNVATGAVPSLDAHPVRFLWERGVPIVLNTDDPAMFHTTLEREYEIAERKFRLPIEELAENSLRYAFRD